MQVNILRARAAFKDFMDALGVPATVTLSGGGSFAIKASPGHKSEQDPTGGLTQEIHSVRIMAEDWDLHSPGRPPQKGDEIAFAGRVHAVEDAYLRQWGTLAVGYVLRLGG